MYIKVACTETHKLNYIYITQATYPGLDENLDISPVSSSSLSQIMLDTPGPRHVSPTNVAPW